MINLLDFDQSAMSAFFAERGDKPFRAKQTLRWIHHALADRVESMTDLAKTTRDALLIDAEIRAPLVPDVILLVRPDGYVACAAQADDVGVIGDYLGAIDVLKALAA